MSISFSPSTHVYDGHPAGVWFPDPLAEQQYLPGRVISISADGTVTSANMPVTPTGPSPQPVPNTGYGVQPAMTVGTV